MHFSSPSVLSMKSLKSSSTNEDGTFLTVNKEEKTDKTRNCVFPFPRETVRFFTTLFNTLATLFGAAFEISWKMTHTGVFWHGLDTVAQTALARHGPEKQCMCRPSK